MAKLIPGGNLIQGGMYGEGKEIQTFPRYDRIKLKNGVMKHTLFDKKTGDDRNGVALTLADTNMEEGGQIPNVMKWEINEVWFQYQGIAERDDADVQNILLAINNSVIDLDVVAKFHTLIANLSLFNGAMQFVHGPSIAGDNIFPQSVPIYSGKLIMDVPIVLESQTTFKLKLEHFVDPNIALDGDYFAFVWWITQFIGPPVGRNR